MKLCVHLNLQIIPLPPCLFSKVLIMDTVTVENQLNSHCMLQSSSHLPEHSILKRVLDLQLLAKVKGFFCEYIETEIATETYRTEYFMRNDWFFIEIENHSMCRPEICRQIQRMGEFIRKRTMVICSHIRSVRETEPPRSKCHRRNWLWIFESRVYVEWRGNLWDWSNGAWRIDNAHIFEK